MSHYWRVIVPQEPAKVQRRCLHGERPGECIKDSRCPLKSERLTWKWLAEFRYKRDAKRFARGFEGAQLVQDEII